MPLFLFKLVKYIIRNKNKIMEHLASFVNLLSIIIGCLGIIIVATSLIIAINIQHRQRVTKQVEKLAMQVAAFYAEEEEAIKRISENENKAQNTVKIELRDAAEKNEISKGIRPNMNPSEINNILSQIK